MSLIPTLPKKGKKMQEKRGNPAQPSTYRVIYELLLGNQTQSEIGRQLGLSRQRINNIKSEARDIIRLYKQRK